MPATLVAPHVAPVTTFVEELSSWERTVALYASDMPTTYHCLGRQDSNLLGWISQGVARLGREETRRRASYLAGYRRVWLRELVTPQIARRHSERFPSVRRLTAAEDKSASSIMSLIRIAPTARNFPVVIDGPCPTCDGAGKLWSTWVVDAEADWTETGYRPCWLCQSEDDAA
ncbi:hypothetical protein [Streptomyces sp. NPDC094437]|uniref:hypothetical protein n=1 Tax=Streptomyces sp. NPDC094437 TaxID=3366060 RepID=UPI0037FF2F7F